MPYRCVATSVQGFIQQLAVSYIARGYWFYVTGFIPSRKEPTAVDAKLVARFGVELSEWARARRKRAGHASIQYLRHQRFFVLLATHGHHPFFEHESNFRDVRRTPLKYGGYSVSYRHSTVTGRGHASVRIEREEFLRLKAFLLNVSAHRRVEDLIETFQAIPYEPYAPVRRQLLELVRAVNRARRAAGFEPVPWECLRMKRRPVRPFAVNQFIEAGSL